MLHQLPPLPSIPGSWKSISHELGGRLLELIVPGDPDQFLDDPAVIAANARDDYMPYWSYLWPAAPPFSRALQRAPWPAGSTILDLGSGIGLSGVSSLVRGDRVIFSDYDEQSLLVCRHNAVRNGFCDPETLRLDWRSPLPRQFGIITGCEVTYEERNHAPLIRLLDMMLAPGGIAWIADPGRFHAPAFHRRAMDAGYAARVLDEELLEQPAPRSNAFQIMELRRAGA
jgi:predicted nicotinamide N-methyase